MAQTSGLTAQRSFPEPERMKTNLVQIGGPNQGFGHNLRRYFILFGKQSLLLDSQDTVFKFI
jgi:hypothetical protein